MTKTWRRFGLDIEVGANYWTIGRVANGESSRFNPNSIEYQSWLGGYTVKLVSNANWSIEDHFKLAIADQKSWLRHYGDRKPVTNVKGWDLISLGEIQAGSYIGQLYEFGCMTHDDVGSGYRAIKLRLASLWMAASFNTSNSNLKLKGYEFVPRRSDDVYGNLKLKGCFAIFDIAEGVKVVLYANGFIDEGKNIDTFAVLKDDFLNTMKSCEIVTV